MPVVHVFIPSMATQVGTATGEHFTTDLITMKGGTGVGLEGIMFFGQLRLLVLQSDLQLLQLVVVGNNSEHAKLITRTLS